MSIDPLANIKASIAAKQQPIDFVFMNLTPNDAKELLGKNAHNRALSDKIVTRYANDITAGRWALTHQCIAVGPDAELVDGQHRLAAIIKSDMHVTIVLAIYRDADMAEEARMKVDLGRARQGGDVLELGGAVEKGMGKRIYAITSALILCEGPQPYGGLTTAHVRARYSMDREAIDFASTLPPKGFVAPTAAAFAYAYPSAKDRTLEFAKLVTQKVGYEFNSAAHHFVRALTEGGFSSSRGNKGDKTEIAYRVLRLIQAHIENETLVKFPISPKGFEFFKARREAMGIK